MHNRTVLMLHGLGGDRHTMLSVGDHCRRHLSKTKFIAIEAPKNLGSEQAPLLGWFVAPDDDNRALEGPNPPKLDGLADSVAMVHERVRDLIDQGEDPHNIHLLGHSQGAATALAAGLTFPTRLGSVCTIAGYLALTPAMRPIANGTKYFIHHSQQDCNVSVRWAHYLQSFVRSVGEFCELRCWDIDRNPHSIHVNQLDAICSEIAKLS